MQPDGKTHDIVKMLFYPNNLLNQSNSNQIYNRIFNETDMLILKFIWKCKGSGIAKTLKKKKNVGGLELPDFRIFFF